MPTPEEIAEYRYKVHKNEFSRREGSHELRQAAAVAIREEIEAISKKPRFRGQSAAIARLWKEYHWINPDPAIVEAA